MTILGERDWLDADGFFLFGRHQGESVERVAHEDPTYLRWFLESVESATPDDREAVEVALRFRGRRR